MTMLWSVLTFAQSDTSNKTSIVILDNEYSEIYQSDRGTVHKLVNNVKIQHGSDILYCDTALYFQGLNRVEAYGNIAIYQEDGTVAYSDYLQYTGNDKTVFMLANQGDVQLSDAEGNTLWSKEVYYNLNTKIGTYRNGGTLQNGFTMVYSDIGTYNLDTKEARFQKNVLIQDPEYDVVSEDLKYNTETEIVTFLKPSIVYSDGAIFQTSGGTYHSVKKEGYFTTRSSMMDDGSYMEADTIYHNEIDSNGWARGNVIIIDTVEQTIIYADFVDYVGDLDRMIATGQPLLEILQEEDNSLFVRGDTFYVFEEPKFLPELSEQDALEKSLEDLQSSEISLAEMIQSGDTLWGFGPGYYEYNFIGEEEVIEEVITDPKEKAPKEEPLAYAEQLNVSSQAKNGKKVDESQEKLLEDISQGDDILLSRLKDDKVQEEEEEKISKIIIYPNPLIYSDSLQAKADSMVYDERDSIFTMYYKPVLWSGNQQVTGEIVHVKMSENNIESFHVPRLGMMVSLNDPEEANFYNQLQAEDIKGFFQDNELERIEARGMASSIYYLQEEDSAYLGVSQASSDDIFIFLEDQEIDVIKYMGPTEQEMSPLHLTNTEEKKLERFIWRKEEQLPSWEAFFATTRMPIQPTLFNWYRLSEQRWGERAKESMELLEGLEDLEKLENDLEGEED